MKRDELSNHRGNVMTVISDKIAPIDTTSDGLWDYFNPSLVSATDYYPFGMGMPGRGIDRDQYKYGFNGQENEYEISDYGNYTTATFWQYDLRLSVRWNLDPVLHAWESGFSVLGRNPILNTDPLGDDWFKDKSGTRQFDPSVKPESKLGEGEVYIGVTDFEITKRGTASYRVDGSILYSDQTDGYKRVWENSKANTKGSEKEQFALILEKGVLVTPDYRNESTESSPVQYGYNFKAERVFDPVSKSYLNIVGTIHSHPLNLGEGSQRPSVWGPYGSDVLTHTSNFPNKPFLTMGWDRKIYGAVGNKDGWSPIEFPPEIKTIDQLLRGYDLRKLILSNQPR